MSLRKVLRPRQPTLVRLTNREIVADRPPSGFWSDLHHRALTARWPSFFFGAAAIFLAFNLVFATLYGLGTDPIANTRPGRFLDVFYFSIETLATVGYGDMHPQTDWAHFVATVEIFTGMSLMAVMTGLVFTRFSRPQARVLFARNPVVAFHDGIATLMLRIANARGNTIAGAGAALWLVRDEIGRDGVSIRRFYRLALERDESPVFMLTWTLFHRLEPSSPLFGADAETLAAGNAALILSLTGVDEGTTQQLMARNTWGWEDILWAHRYADMLHRDAEGRLHIDYAHFHDVVAQDTPPDATGAGAA